MNPPRRRHLASSPFAPPTEIVPAVFAVGQQVSHDTYGLGRVVSLTFTTGASIDFGREVRHIALPTSKLVGL